jgi:dephospho-CoA kinase
MFQRIMSWFTSSSEEPELPGLEEDLAEIKKVNKPPHTVIFGLTGGIASGKSTVARMFAAKGVPIIDADMVARTLVEPGKPVLKDIAELLGPEVILADGTMDRKRVGALIFGDDDLRKKFDALMEPLLREAIDAECEKYRAQKVLLVCLDAPLLIEKGWQDDFRPVVLVACSPRTQISRLMKRNHLTEDEAKMRLAAQFDPDRRQSYADHLILTGMLWAEDDYADVPLEQVEERALEVLGRIRDGALLGHY